MKRQCVLGIVAHVDAGKTTLTEGMLYESGTIRHAGRVDHGDTFLDTDTMERDRGITIFSKQARMKYKELDITLLDTPGHVDFSAEMERSLQVMDYCILVISGADGVQAHTQTLWRLLGSYRIPVFLFINKMDQPGTKKDAIMESLQKKLDVRCVDFTGITVTEERISSVSVDCLQSFEETIATCNEEILNAYLEQGTLTPGQIQNLIADRELFPCFFGSALKMEGVAELLDGLSSLVLQQEYGQKFAARVYKISRDEQKNRLTWMKITGGSLKVRSILGESQEKVTQIRLYSGEKYTTTDEVAAGCVCAVLGLDSTKSGQSLGEEKEAMAPLLEPVITYRLELPPEIDASQMLPKLREIEEEEPELHILWDEQLKEIQAQLMGEVQIEILKRQILDRYKTEVKFGTGRIVYRETIKNTVEGVGHFEPLRHYAEVHLLLEPGEPGSGLQFFSDCSEDILDKNWQRLILTHLEERIHRGVLTGAPITDMRITLLTGRAHPKHTEGGDFRQATYRAIRQGLMQAENLLLEPYYSYHLQIPENVIGRAMNDMERKSASCYLEHTADGQAWLIGSGPVSTLNGYQTEVVAYTKGLGKFTCEVAGYAPCHNTQEVLENTTYDPEADVRNPSSSVFCAHGAGFIVPWNEVYDYMHLESVYLDPNAKLRREEEEPVVYSRSAHAVEKWIGTEEVDEILNRTLYANRKKEFIPHKGIRSRKAISAPEPREVEYHPSTDTRQDYLLVDGYNVIYAWKELRELSQRNMDSARDKLMDILCNYQGIKKCELIVVFDAYKVTGHATDHFDYHNIHVVYTKEAETADQFIEKFAHVHRGKYKIRVVTSDGLEQIIIRGEGCLLVSSREFEEEVRLAEQTLREDYLEKQKGNDCFHHVNVLKYTGL